MRAVKCRDFSLLFTLAGLCHNHACPRCVAAVVKGPFKETKRKASYEWIIDSGATVHCVNDFSLLTSVYTDHDPVHIKVADKRVIRASAVGTAIVSMADNNGCKHQVTLHNVVYHPSFQSNLLSVRRLWRDNRMSAKFHGETNYLNP